ncbi:MAG: hypothetical protein ACXW4Q_11265 [Anaerolineales bacterium]
MSKPLLMSMVLSLLLAGCLGGSESTVLPETLMPPPPSPIPSTLTATATPPPTPSGTMLPTSTPEPIGCRKPPDDYTRVKVNGWTINQRTLAILAHAQGLYGGELELTGHAITQGSYHDNGSASFGTHLGGGAVDLSVLRRGTYTVLWDDVEPLIHALRVAGFAAWLREYGELYADSPIHIHAIAIGDQELSAAAEEQLTGPAGYFRGYSGLPIDGYGPPAPDRYGGPMLCQWMIELGYEDLR